MLFSIFSPLVVLVLSLYDGAKLQKKLGLQVWKAKKIVGEPIM
jgi:hypothetical protein